MEQINSLSMERLNNGAHFLFVTDVCTRAEADEKVKTKAAGEVTNLKNAVKDEDEALVISRKSLLTDELKEADKERDLLYRTLRNLASDYRTYPVDAQAVAAKRLYQLVKDYNIDPQIQLDAETGLLINLVDDLETKAAADVTALGITPLVTALKAANEKVRSITGARSDDRALKIMAQLKAARAASDKACRALLVKVDALALVEGKADYAAFIAFANEKVKHYKQEAISARKKKEVDPKQPKDPKPKPGGGDDIHVPEEPPKKPDEEQPKPNPGGGDSGGDDIQIPSEPPKKPEGQG